MSLIKNLKILQIIPANGYQAVFQDDDHKKYTQSVICWALVEGTDVDGNIVQRIEGMSIDFGGEIDFCNDGMGTDYTQSYFRHYLEPGETLFDEE